MAYGDAAIEVRKFAIMDEWHWSCAVCHYGMDIPWEKAHDWSTAMREVDEHVAEHARVGMVPTWKPVL